MKPTKLLRQSVVLPFVLASIACVRSSAADSTAEVDKFFKSHPILAIEIEIGPKEMDALRREPRKYVKATVKEGATVFKDVGVHLKGAAGSFRGVDDKPGLTLNMDKFVDDQKFHGMDKWHLGNSVQDPSYIQELLCAELFRAAGVPAARIAHASVTINGKRKGFYFLKEGYDKGFLNRHFGSKNGNFYDGGFLRELDQPLQLISGKGDVENHGDLKALFAAAREPDAAKRFAAIQQHLEVEKFATYLSLEVLCWDWDGYPMNRNNYRIYHDPKINKLVFIPSGMDQMFGDPNGKLFPPFQGFLARAFLETPQGREMFLKRTGELLDTVFKPDTISKRLEELEARVRPGLTAVDAGAGRDHPHHINRIRSAVKQREVSIREQLRRVVNPTPRKTVAGGPGLADDGFLRSWLFLGPIANGPTNGVAALNRDFLGGEAKVRPAAGEKAKTPSGEIAWKAVDAQDGMVNFCGILGRACDNSTGYVACYLVTEAEFKNLKLKLGSDDQAKVWINGKEVHRCDADRGVVPDQDTAENITLVKGVNTIVFKVVNGGGDWGGCIRLVKADGSPFMDARATLKPDGSK